MSLRDAIVPVLDRCFRTGGILSYHAVVADGEVPSPAMHISAATLRRQLTYLRERYTVLPLRELTDRHVRRRPTDRCVAITFDDAYVGVEQLAAPMLRELDLTATIFVTVNTADRRGTYWWDEVDQARTNEREWTRTLRALGLAPMARDASSVAAIREEILARRCGRADTAGAHAVPDLLHAMDFPGLRRLVEDERFDVGCHTVTHPALPCLSAAEQEREMGDAHRRLADELPRVVPIIAYPYGLYDGETVQAARRVGLAAGVTMQPCAINRGDSAFALPRVGVSEDWSASGIALRMNTGLRPLFIARMAGRRPRRATALVPATG